LFQLDRREIMVLYRSILKDQPTSAKKPDKGKKSWFFTDEN
jgi:hypothetical protein